MQEYLRLREREIASSFYQEFVYFGDCEDALEVCDTKSEDGF
jgi:hypothetical protein